ncbi:hypothetical protein Ancab_000992 [Ancistrocladus abbreviatus]
MDNSDRPHQKLKRENASDEQQEDAEARNPNPTTSRGKREGTASEAENQTAQQYCQNLQHQTHLTTATTTATSAPTSEMAKTAQTVGESLPAEKGHQHQQRIHAPQKQQQSHHHQNQTYETATASTESPVQDREEPAAPVQVSLSIKMHSNPPIDTPHPVDWQPKYEDCCFTI